MCIYQQEQEPLGRLIYFMAQDLCNFAEKILRPYDLPLEQFHILKCLALSSGIPQKEICSAANKTPANATRLLDRLEEKKLVERRKNPEDRRSSLVFVTDRGLSLVTQVTEKFESITPQLEQGVTDQDQQIIRSSFDKIKSNLTKMNQELNEP